MKVFDLTYDELNELHQLTDQSYFKDNKGNVATDALGGNYVFWVDKFILRFPRIDISKYSQKDYVRTEI